jgi:hypothetical protein
VPFEEFPVRRLPVDVPLDNGDVALRQITSGMAAGRSGRLPEERR